MAAPADHYRRRIDAYLDRSLAPADEAGMTAARELLDERPNRWYGRLVIASDAAADSASDPREAVPAAAAIELVAGYCRLRSELLVQLADTRAHSITRDPIDALLAGDYLYSAAFAAVGAQPSSAREAAFATLADLLETLAVAFGTHRAESDEAADHAAFVDRTAGSLGAGAARLGALQAGGANEPTDRLETIGRGLATARQIERALDADPDAVKVVPQAVDAEALRTHATARRTEACQALEDLSAGADVAMLRTLADTRHSSSEGPQPTTEDGPNP